MHMRARACQCVAPSHSVRSSPGVMGCASVGPGVEAATRDRAPGSERRGEVEPSARISDDGMASGVAEGAGADGRP